MALIIKLPVSYSKLEYIKDNKKHYKGFVHYDDNKPDAEFDCDVIIPAGSVCEFKISSITDIISDSNGRYKPGRSHGRITLDFVKVSS